MEIFKRYSDIQPYIDKVKNCADQHRKEFGFLPEGAYYDQAMQEKLWVAIDLVSGRLLGYLMFGGKYPNLKIFQMFVSPKYRGQGIAQNLLYDLILYGEKRGILNIKVRVASDLKVADSFWRKNGFKLVVKKQGGASTNRTIHVRVRELMTPSLLSLIEKSQSPEKIQYAPSPVAVEPLYILDINVFLDVIKNRAYSVEASSVISAALNNQIKLNVTSEFVRELEKQNGGREADPILEFARTIPALNEVNSSDFSEIINAIRPIVFPHTSLTCNKADNNKSDLIHLATCIYYSVKGFVTRDKAILRARNELEKLYKLDITSPSDFIQPFEERVVLDKAIHNFSSNQDIQIKEAGVCDDEMIQSFLLEQGLDKDEAIKVWKGGPSSSKQRRIYAASSEGIIGVASWNIPSIHVPDLQFNLYVNEYVSSSEKIIDHAIELIVRDLPAGKLMKIILNTGKDQDLTRRTAQLRGYNQTGSSSTLAKVAMNGFVDLDGWKNFRSTFVEIAGISLPEEMPHFEVIKKFGISLLQSGAENPVSMSVFDFETMLSPTVFLWPNRDASIVAIQKTYSEELLINSSQRKLFPSKEALLHVEKAYFRSPNRASFFPKGDLIVFYESGKQDGKKQAIGIGRVTYSEIIPASRLGHRFVRQGVLEIPDIESFSDKKGNIHVFTFDNFTEFLTPLSFKALQGNGCISKANLVTVERLNSQSIKYICSNGFNPIRKNK